MNNSALVTGGAGFIGSHLCEELINRGFNVLCVDNLFRGTLINLQQIINNKNFSFFSIDLLNFDSINNLVKIIIEKQPKYIFHYAAINGTKYFYDIPYKVACTNSIASFNLLESLNKVFIIKKDYKPLLIFASSSEVYGSAKKIPISEDSITSLRLDEDRDSYAAGKLMSEFYVKHFSKKNNLNYFIFRIFNVYGPRMINTKYGQVIPELIFKALKAEKTLPIIGTGKETRSFCFINDHINLSLKAIENAKYCEVYNIGNPEEITIKVLANKIIKNTKKKLKIVTSKLRSGDPLRRSPSIEKVKEYIGDFKFTPLESGLDKIIVNYK